MSQKATTKDELFLLKLHQIAMTLGGPQEAVDRYAIGRAIGQNDRGVDTIARLLAQANFVKKGDEPKIYLTEQGLRLIEQLLVQ